MVWETIVSGVLGRIIYGMVGFLHANLKDGESLDWQRLGKQSCVALIISVIAVWKGMDLGSVGDATTVTMISVIVEKLWSSLQHKISA